MSEPLLHVALHRPEIPQNTGNIGRLCAIGGVRLHLIHPLGFTITDRHLRRSGMDYWHSLDKKEHADWAAFRADPDGQRRIWLFTTQATKSYWDVSYQAGDVLLFGNEGSGCPPEIHQEVGNAHRVCIPHLRSDLRSLNLSTSVGIAVYEVLRQTWRGAGKKLPHHCQITKSNA